MNANERRFSHSMTTQPQAMPNESTTFGALAQLESAHFHPCLSASIGG